MSNTRLTSNALFFTDLLDKLTALTSSVTPVVHHVDIIFRAIEAQLKTIRNSYSSITADSFAFMEIRDIFYSVKTTEEIIALYHDNPESTEWKTKATNFLAARADVVLNSPLCYTINPRHPVNDLCMMLARLCDPTKPITLLMPNVRSEDIYGNELDKLSIDQFILADDKKSFISLIDIVDTVFSRSTEAEENLYLTTTEDGQQRCLSKNEIFRMGDIYQRLEAIRSQINDRGFLEGLLKRSENKLRKELLALRQGLLAGDRAHGGTEMNAGVAANTAIVNFRLYYETLNPQKQTQLRAISGASTNLGEIFDIIFRDPDQSRVNRGDDVIYCMQIVGGKLATIISENANILDGIKDSTQECIERMKSKLLTDIKHRHAIHLCADKVATLADQLNVLINDMTAMVNRHTKNPSLSACLKAMFELVVSECLRAIKNGHYNEKLNCCANLLLGIALETATFDHRSPEDNNLVLNEIFRRISLLMSCSTAYIALNEPSSKKNFTEWMQQNQLMRAFPFNMNDFGSIKYIGDYTALYPLNGQSNIINPPLITLREQEMAERESIKSEIERQNRIQARRETSLFRFFYPAGAINNPQPAPPCPFSRNVTTAAATTVAAGVTALITYRLLM